jgi:hypothetical protein
MAWIAGGWDSVDPITVEPPSDGGDDGNWDFPDPTDGGDDGGGDDGGGGGGGGGSDPAETLANLVQDILARALNIESWVPHKIAERNQTSNFNRDTVNTHSSNGHTYWTEKSDGTLWVDVDSDGKPETHVKEYSDGTRWMDSNFDGVYDTQV